MYYIYWRNKAGREDFVTTCDDFDSAVTFIRNEYVRDYKIFDYMEPTYYFMIERN